MRDNGRKTFHDRIRSMKPPLFVVHSHIIMDNIIDQSNKLSGYRIADQTRLYGRP